MSLRLLYLIFRQVLGLALLMGRDRMLIFGEQHLRGVLATYAKHYNGQRPHRALQLRPPRPEPPVPEPIHGKIRRRSILGGLINHYEVAA